MIPRKQPHSVGGGGSRRNFPVAGFGGGGVVGSSRICFANSTNRPGSKSLEGHGPPCPLATPLARRSILSAVLCRPIRYTAAGGGGVLH